MCFPHLLKECTYWKIWWWGFGRETFVRWWKLLRLSGLFRFSFLDGLVNRRGWIHLDFWGGRWMQEWILFLETCVLRALRWLLIKLHLNIFHSIGCSLIIILVPSSIFTSWICISTVHAQYFPSIPELYLGWKAHPTFLIILDATALPHLRALADNFIEIPLNKLILRLQVMRLTQIIICLIHIIKMVVGLTAQVEGLVIQGLHFQ